MSNLSIKLKTPKIRLKNKVYILLFVLSVLLFSIIPSPVDTYYVTKVDDGDTIKVVMNGKTETIRFIGVDTPETHDPRKSVQCYGEAASEFTSTLLDSKYVRLEADPLGTNRDRYNRLLRYIYVDDVLVNEELVKQGYGFANLGFPFTKSGLFERHQDNARTNNLGLWGNCQVNQLDSGQLQTNDED